LIILLQIEKAGNPCIESIGDNEYLDLRLNPIREKKNNKPFIL